MGCGALAEGKRRGFLLMRSVEGSKTGTDVAKHRHAVALQGDDALPKDLLDRVLAMVPDKLQNKVGLALKRNTRVILVKNPETHQMLDVAKQFDKAKRMIGSDFSQAGGNSDKSARAVAKFDLAMKTLDVAVRDVCQAAGIPYFSPMGVSGETKQDSEVSLVEVMRAGTYEWKLKNVYRAALGFLVVAGALEVVMEHLPEDVRETARKAVVEVRQAVSAVAEEE